MDRSSQLPGLAPRHDATSRVQKTESAADKMAALKARIAAAVGSSKAKGGLNVNLHPALEDLGQWKSSKQGDSKQSSSAGLSRSTPALSTSVSQRKGREFLGGASKPGTVAGGKNPYIDDASAATGPSGKQRQSRQLIFNQKGKYIQQANALRKQAALEQLKKRIADQTRRAGIDEDIDVEKNFAVEAPPDIEWFDAGLVDGPNYDEIEDSAKLKLDTEDSIITEFIQHPVPLEPPQDKHIPPPKPMYLTQKEQAKLRRQRRMADLKEEQAKIRLGLVPAPPPKIKRGNWMNVLGAEAVNDPTALSIKVEQEISARHQEHMQVNEDRKLTKEQKREKLAANQEKDDAKGIHTLVFKVGSLANGQHRYKIAVNAEQLTLTGICIMHPKFCLVVVEGGAWSIAKYRKLMLQRIDWTENLPSRKDEKGISQRQWLIAEDEKGGLKDLHANKCDLVWEGEVKTRAFKRFGSRIVETDQDAREILARVKMEPFWGQAKNLS